jgi:hypothetical protein
VGVNERAFEERGLRAEPIVNGHREHAMIKEKLRLARAHIPS